MADLRAGVPVYPAAPGTVRSVRDGEPDTGYSEETRASIDGKECGNGVVVSHGDGWETQYCHLKNGSVAVRRARGSGCARSWAKSG